MRSSLWLKIFSLSLIVPYLSGCQGSEAPQQQKSTDQPITITFLYEQQLQSYIRPLVEQFQLSQPRLAEGTPIQVNLYSSSSLEAMRSVADGSIKGDLWLSSSSTFINWSNNNLENLGAKHDACKELFYTPLVLAAAKNKVSKLEDSKTLFPLSKSIQNGGVTLHHLVPRNDSNTLYSVAQALEALEKETNWTKQDFQRNETFIDGYTINRDSLLRTIELTTDTTALAAVTEQELLTYKTSANLTTIRSPYGEYHLDYQVCYSTGDWVTPARRAASEILVNWISSKESQDKIKSLGYRTDSKKDNYLSLSPEQLDVITKDWEVARRKSTLVVIADRSGSIEPNHLSSTQRGLRYLFAKRSKEEPSSLITISTTPLQRVPFTTDAERLVEVVDKLYPLGGSALYDSLRLGFDEFQSESFKKLEGKDNRKILLLISDGEDTNSRLSFSSTRHLVKTRSKLHDIKLIVLALPTTPERKEILRKLAEVSAGIFIETSGYELDNYLDQLFF